MANSNILGGDKAPQTPPGHGTADLGPSDSSDSGSDVASTPPLHESIGTGPDPLVITGRDDGRGVGPDLGDTNLDSDTDAGGTGERAGAGRDNAAEAGDIDFDRITDQPGGLVDGDDPEGIGVTRRRK